MAQEESTSVETKLFSRRAENKTLAQAAKEYFAAYGSGFALLYSPQAAYLARLESESRFVASSGKEAAPADVAEEDWRNIFEARIFNNAAELRWRNEESGAGAAVVLSRDDSQEFFGEKPTPYKTGTGEEARELVGAIEQVYLLWGQSAGAAQNGWARFAEARIGSFFVPLQDITAKTQRAQFTAVEYLGEYEDGNVAVCEERLTGIEPVPAQEQNHG